ncbi:MAG: orotidine-5'-phosphate decarboxylase [Parcubacteria group bacterium]|nr:orotidine-5'-phosphate decarboxylase [Parcubacteria group bacterium]
MNLNDKNIVALDELTLEQSLALIHKTNDKVYAYKIHNLWDQHGPSVVEQLKKAGAQKVWVDLKFKDIPNTVKLRSQAVRAAGADILTVHASGGIKMMKAALQSGIPEVYAVTVLTSLSEEETQLLHGHSSKATVLHLAQLAKLAGVHGIVCSPQEVGILSEASELKPLKLIVPGVRSAGQSAEDQQRVDTPAAAIQAGATHLVIGRQITQADDPVEALKNLSKEIEPHLQSMASPILVVKNLTELRQLKAENLLNYQFTAEDFRHLFELCDALWLHNGDPKDPHAELTSGLCSNGFIDTLRVLQYPNLCDILGYQLACKIKEHYAGHIDWVVGSDHAAATLSFTTAKWLSAKHDFTEKGPDKTQVWKRFTIEPTEIVLQVEELVTTTGTLQAVRNGIRTGNAHPVTFAPVVITAIHRSDISELEGSPILYLAHYDIQNWDPKVCPLCAAGSQHLRPKQNWKQLTKK